MMTKDKKKKIPSKKAIARQFAEGKVCNYPAHIVLDAVNSYDFGYNSITIPVRIGFEQTFTFNIEAFAYLSKHRTADVFSAFLTNPDTYMTEVGINLPTPFDDITPKIMVAMLEDEMYEAIMSEDDSAVCSLLKSSIPNSWVIRHSERYSSTFMQRRELEGLCDYHKLTEERLASYGFPYSLSADLTHIKNYFTEE